MNSEIVFVADVFANEFIGGAELTTQALIDSCKFTYTRVHAKDVTAQLIELNKHKYWIFGNCSSLNFDLFPLIISNLRYSVLEYDYKYCKYRSPEKHQATEGRYCNCHDTIHGQTIAAFFYAAKSTFWMSEAQQDRYATKFPFLTEKKNIVLSSVFDDEFFAAVKILNERYKDHNRTKWIVLGSDSWVKGYSAAKQYCDSRSLDYEVISGVAPGTMLDILARAKGLVYLPNGPDTCPRLVIEAKLLGCELVLNDYVQHRYESWFDTDDKLAITEYLYSARDTFWKQIEADMSWQPKLSGYTTTYNCIKQNYPFVQSIESMLGFCDEICVLDGGSTDGTYETLLRLAAETVVQDPKTGEPVLKIRVKQIERDWKSPGFSVFDGMQKAEARAMCKNEFLWQQDVDEIVHEDDYDKIKKLAASMNAGLELVSLPVIEYWGSADKVRIDVTPWKWRLSRNNRNITHGAPANLRVYGKDGKLEKFLPGTDGCDMIYADTGQPVPHVTFYDAKANSLRSHALSGNGMALKQYEEWFNSAVNELPCVFHYSWFDIKRKIKLYRDYWLDHWSDMYERRKGDNLFFDKPWNEVTDEEIHELAIKLATETGGHVFHSRWSGKRTPHIKVNRTQPAIMLSSK
jgi:glycosyltransferase involved in cell wall biosynthesis